VLQGLLALFAIVLLAGVILVVIRGFLLRPLQAITERFASVGANGTERAPQDDASFCEELRALSQEQARIASLTEREGEKTEGDS
jgi:hypothetical protein